MELYILNIVSNINDRTIKKYQSFKFELMPNGEQRIKMLKFSGCVRFVYNKALTMQKDLYSKGEKRIGYFSMCKELTKWRGEYSWLYDSPCMICQQSLKNLEVAYKNFFNKTSSFPQFKKKGVSDSFRFPLGFKLEQNNNRIYLPKLGWIRYRNSREVIGKINSVTVSHKSGNFILHPKSNLLLKHINFCIQNRNFPIKSFPFLF